MHAGSSSRDKLNWIYALFLIFKILCPVAHNLFHVLIYVEKNVKDLLPLFHRKKKSIEYYLSRLKLCNVS